MKGAMKETMKEKKTVKREKFWGPMENQKLVLREVNHF